jgi:hypothetical protein
MKSMKIVSVIVTALAIGCCSHEAASNKGGETIIHYKYNFKDELNSRDSTYTKDLVGAGDTTTTLFLTDEEKRKIVKLAKEVRFFEMPDTLEFTDEVQTIPEPGMQMLYIKHGEIENRVNWRIYDLNNVDQNAYERIMKLGRFIDEIVREKEEYKKLPPPQGGYR